MLPLLFISFLCPGRVHLTVVGDRFVFSSSSLQQKLSLPFAAGSEVVVPRALVVRPPCGACWPPVSIPQPEATSCTTSKVPLGFSHLTLVLGRSLGFQNLRVSWFSCPCGVRWLQGQSPGLVNWCCCLWQPPQIGCQSHRKQQETAKWGFFSIVLICSLKNSRVWSPVLIEVLQQVPSPEEPKPRTQMGFNRENIFMNVIS